MATADLPVANLTNTNVVSASMSQLSPEQLAAPPPGQRSWNGTSWVPDSSCPTGKVLVFVHGMESSVEDAFGDSAESIITAGGYQQAVGYDYDWTGDINTNGAGLAGFLNTLAACPTVTGIDLEAHSEGGPVALSALCKTTANIGYFIGLGGALEGSPLANASPSWVTALSALYPGAIAFWPEIYKTLSGISNTTAATELVPGSPVLSGILACGATVPNTRFILIAGDECSPTSCVNSNLTDDEAALLGSLFSPSGSDCVVPTTSALASGSSLKVIHSATFPVCHTGLESNQNIINYVGGAVSQPLPTPTATPTPTPSPSPSPSSAPTPAFTFTVPAQLPSVPAGSPYSYYFCDPPPAAGQDCGSSATNPMGGNPPYTFSTQGFPPFGLTLNSQTGQLSGTPSSTNAGNTKTFAVCATDLSDSQACTTTSLYVGAEAGTYTVSLSSGSSATCDNPPLPTVPLTGTGTYQFSNLDPVVTDGDTIYTMIYSVTGSIALSADLRGV